MGQDFDGYYKWLGIAASEQPPHHYRLLSIRLYEDDADVIANAADRQMAHMRSFQAGKHSALSQQILNEMAAARICLLNPAKKAAYDAKLRKTLPGESEGPTLQAELLPDESPLDAAIAEAAVANDAPQSAPASRQEKKPLPQRGTGRKPASWQAIAVLAGVGLLLCLGLVAVLATGHRSPEQIAEDQPMVRTASEPSTAESPKPDAGDHAGGEKAPQPPASPEPKPPAELPARADSPGDNPSSPPAHRGPVIRIGPLMRPGPGPAPAVSLPAPAAPMAMETVEKADERLQAAVKAAHSTDEYRSVARDTLRLADRALTEGKRDLGERASVRSLAAARKADDSRLATRATAFYLQAKGELPRSPLREDEMGMRPAAVPRPAFAPPPVGMGPRPMRPDPNLAIVEAVPPATRQKTLDFLARMDARVQYGLPSKPGWGFGGGARRLPSEPIVLQNVTLADPQVQDADLANLAGAPEINNLGLNSPGITDAGLEQLHRFANLRALNLGGSSVTGRGFQTLATLPRLADLDLSRTKITDADLPELKNLPNLRTLNLADTRVTNAGLAHLGALPNLLDLNLDGTSVSDAGLAQIRVTGTLSLERTRITDAGLEHLKSLGRLRRLRLRQTSVTDQGLESLHAAMPRCRIEK